MIILAATKEVTAEDYQRIIVGSLVVVGLIVVAFVLVTLVRRRLKQGDDSTSSGGTGFTLSDLRQLHKSGQMSDEEFERAKAKIVEAAKRASDGAGLLPSTAIRDRRQAHTEGGVETKPFTTGKDDDASPPAGPP
jgi:hypothetical protein